MIKKGEFSRLINQYAPDVLCLQETKARPNQIEIDLPEYQEFWNSADRAGYAGTAIFVKNSVLGRHDPISEAGSPRLTNKDALVDHYGDLTKEGRIITAEFADFFLVNVYTPNAKEDLSRLSLRERWDAAFLNYLEKLCQAKPVIFCGDLNVAHREIDLARPHENVGKHGFTDAERAGFQQFLDAGFTDVFRHVHGDKPHQYTWWTPWAQSRARNVGWRIDYFLASHDIIDRVTAAAIHPEQMGSDHCPISIELSEKL